jgi:DNA-binding beta-propeller fold protein YncE
MTTRTTIVYTILAAVLMGVAACSAPDNGAMTAAAPMPAPAPAPAPMASNEPEPLLSSEIVARIAERTASRVPEGASAPSFIVDPSWPKPLPNNWRIGQVGGLTVDHNDNIWIFHRPRSLERSAAAGEGIAGTDANGNPVDGLGNPRPFLDQAAGCCEAAPSVLKFDREGNLLDAWGGPQDEGFLENNCRAEDGCYWPGREHGIYVDHNDFVYLSGNGTNFTGQFPWAATFGDDSHILKFTDDGEFVYQMGHAGMEGPDSENIDGGPNGTPQPYLVADFMVDANTNRLYVADGYGNRRILVADAETGQYIGHFGAYGQNPVDDPAGTDIDPYNTGPWAGDYQMGNMKPMFFRSPMHCAIVANDGLLYACDRGNNRIQIFDTNVAGGECSNPNAEEGQCGFVRELFVAPQSYANGTAVAAEFSTDPEQSCLYVGDLANGTLYIIDRESMTELDRIGRAGRQVGEFHWIHALGVDSDGNIYSGEVDTGQRVQKWQRYGETGCSGTGYADVGSYARNR